MTLTNFRCNACQQFVVEEDGQLLCVNEGCLRAHRPQPEPFDDVDRHRAKDLAALLVLMGRTHLEYARLQANDAIDDAAVAQERLEYATKMLDTATSDLERALRYRAELE